MFWELKRERERKREERESGQMRDIDKSGETREEKRETLREMVMEGDLGEGGTGGVVGEIKRFSPASSAASGCNTPVNNTRNSRQSLAQSSVFTSGRSLDPPLPTPRQNISHALLSPAAGETQGRRDDEGRTGRSAPETDANDPEGFNC